MRRYHASHTGGRDFGVNVHLIGNDNRHARRQRLGHHDAEILLVARQRKNRRGGHCLHAISAAQHAGEDHAILNGMLPHHRLHLTLVSDQIRPGDDEHRLFRPGGESRDEQIEPLLRIDPRKKQHDGALILKRRMMFAKLIGGRQIFKFR